MPFQEEEDVLAVVAGLFAASPLLAAEDAKAPATKELNGPFVGWKTLQADFGAVGDGKADDTAAIQKALGNVRSKDFQRQTRRHDVCQVDLLIHTRTALYVSQIKFRRRIDATILVGRRRVAEGRPEPDRRLETWFA